MGGGVIVFLLISGRLLEALKDQDIIRAHEELQRSFYKALNELRRHQTWRKQAIDVKEEVE